MSSEMNIGLVPPHVRLTWAATGHGASWRAYIVYRRQSSPVVTQWLPLGLITAGRMSYVNAEAYKTEFRDYTAKWAPARYDYYVAVLADSGFASKAGENIVTGVQATPSDRWWLVNNVYPEICTPIDSVTDVSSQVTETVQTWQAAGRDYQIAAQAGTRPAVSKQLSALWYGAHTDTLPGGEGMISWIRDNIEDPLRRPKTWCMHSHQGDRWYGVLQFSEWEMSADKPSIVTADLDFFETADEEASEMYVPWQGPAYARYGTTNYHQWTDGGIAGDGSTLDFGDTDSFTVLFYGRIRSNQPSGGALISKAAYSAGPSGAGWCLYSLGGAARIGLYVKGSSGSALSLSDSSLTHNDGLLHVWGARFISGGLSTLWRDGVLLATSGTDPTTGSLANAVPFQINGINGANAISQFDLATAIVWNRALSNAEMQTAAYAVQRQYAFKVPYGTVFYADTSDETSYTGATINDLSGHVTKGQIVSASAPIWVVN